MCLLIIVTHRYPCLASCMCHFDSFIDIWCTKPSKPCHRSSSYTPPRATAVPYASLASHSLPRASHASDIMIMSLLAMPAVLSAPCHPLCFCHVSYRSIYVSWLRLTSPGSDSWTIVGWPWIFRVDFDHWLQLLSCFWLRVIKISVALSWSVFCINS